MKTPPVTSACPFANYGTDDVLEASEGIPVHVSLNAATDRLEAVVAGLRELMQEPAVTQLATLTFYAAEAALALVYASRAGVESRQGGAA